MLDTIFSPVADQNRLEISIVFSVFKMEKKVEGRKKKDKVRIRVA